MTKSSLEKITLGLAIDEVNKEAGISKIKPTPMDDEAINRYITARNERIIVAPPYGIMRFKKSRTEEAEEKPAE